jgi:hypothetical protein
MSSGIVAAVKSRENDHHRFSMYFGLLCSSTPKPRTGTYRTTANCSKKLQHDEQILILLHLNFRLYHRNTWLLEDLRSGLEMQICGRGLQENPWQCINETLLAPEAR